MAQITNTASATYGYGRASTDSVISNTTSTTLNEDYSISASNVSLVQNFRNGENITYQIIVTCAGLEAITNVIVSDDLGGTSEPLSFANGSASLNIDGNNTLIVPTSTNPLTFEIATLTAGQTATITYVARVSSSLESTISSITNTATITAQGGSETISPEQNPSATITREEYADLTITKSVSVSEINIGEEFSFILQLENNGNLPATSVVITDTLPENFTVSSITLTQGGVTSTIPSSDYEIEPTSNTLTLPISSGTTEITVSPSEIVSININGMIN